MKNPNMINRISLMLISSMLLCMAPSIGVASEMPNIVFIFADDLGYADLSCYGHPYAKTPALDSLAAEGVRFTQMYVTGITCNPSRTGFMTARAHQRYVENTKDVGFGEHITITELLKNHGYRTGHFGKWHIGPVSTPGTYGIDEIDTPSGNGDALDGRDGVLFNNAIAFIDNHTQNHPGVPFYVNIWGHSTHYAVNPPAEYVAEFAGLVVDRDDFFTHAVNPDNDIMGIQEKFDRSMCGASILRSTTKDEIKRAPLHRAQPRPARASQRHASSAPYRGTELLCSSPIKICRFQSNCLKFSAKRYLPR